MNASRSGHYGLKVLLAASLCLLVPSALVLAGGAGGIDYGYQYFDGGLSSSDMGMSFITGYGYGVHHDGSRIGGFGSSLVSAGGDAAGGIGGLLVGQEWRTGPVVAAVTLWGGLGGAAWAGRGYMLASVAVEAELGFRVLPWMQVVGYAGYQAIGNVLPGALFSRALLRTPVVGIRLAWGGFS
jgi:hypothetical protein